jgi:hypothetical protein
MGFFDDDDDGGFFDVIGDVIDVVTDVGGDIIDVGGDIIGGIGGGIGDIIDAGGDIIEGIGGSSAGGPGDSIFDTILDVGGNIIDTFIDIGGNIIDALPESIKKLPGAVGATVKDQLSKNGGDIAAALFKAAVIHGTSDDPSEISAGNALDVDLLRQTTALQPGPAAATAFLADQFGLGRAPGSEFITFPEDFERFLTEPRIDPSIPEATQGIIDTIPGLLDESVGNIQGLAPIVQDIAETGGLDIFEDAARRAFFRDFLPGAAERFPDLGFGSGAEALTERGARDIATDFSLAAAERQLKGLGLAPSIFSLPTILSTETGGALQKLGQGQSVVNRLGSEGGSQFMSLGQLNAISQGLGIPFQQEVPNIGGGTGSILADLAAGANLGPVFQDIIDRIGS